ncbi:SDR family NAD(P)-dependent oxidoreductase [Alcanivorax marinus]|uniref:SDR family NAD(P)-dependent oxidoreductase n=1 Tax=Alloalcanivorax marinus TaxID=1177169 RepID=A0A9Q3UQT1_9GAMM|nr:SDR family NAD(P)-dependent oxidoreductase [Alloalcanivorax marinus]MCC4309844.1 SDR family NAD(P)-dependent oxidoreductase [Alloalcanivorax marinus]
MSFNGKTIVLTGASSGIGEEAARQLARRGARLCLLARREEELARVQADILADGGRAWIYPTDLTHPDSIDTALDALLAEHPRVDALVNNAAHSIRRPIVDALDRVHDYERTMQLNYFGALRMTMGLIPRFLAQGHGHVVNASTLSAQVPIPLFSAYLASKAALESYSRSLNAELGHKGIRATMVYFPMVRTPMSSRTSIYKHMRMMKVEDAAGWVLKALRDQPARVGSPLGTVGSLVLAAVPGPAVKYTQPFFRRMDRRLKAKLGKSWP